MLNNSLIRHPFLLITIFYFLSYWPILLNSGIQWDDVGSFGVDYAALREQALQLTGGNPLRFYLGYFFVFIDPEHTFTHIFQFITFLFVFYVFYIICRAMPVLKDKHFETVSIALLTTTAPTFFSRFFLCMLPQEIYVFAFVCGVYFFQKYLCRKSTYSLAASVALLFFSCDYPSICPLYYPVIYFLIVQYDGEVSSTYVGTPIFTIKSFISSVIIALKKYHALWTIPVAAFILNKFVFTPYGIYTGYNTLGHLSIKSILASLLNNLLYPLALIIKMPSLSETTYALAGLGVFLLGVWIFYGRSCDRSDFSQNIRQLAAAMVLYIAAIFAYVALGRKNGFNPAETRDQILVIFALGFLIFFFIKTVIKREFVWFTLAVVLASFVAANVTGHLAILKQAVEKDAFALGLASSEEIKNCSTIEVKNFPPLHQWGTDHISFYEYGYIFQKAYGKDAYLVYSDNTSPEFLPILKKYTHHKAYHFSQWNENGAFCVLKVRHTNGKPISTMQALKYSLGKTFKIASLTKTIDGAIELRVQPENESQ